MLTPDEIKALACFLAGMAVAGALACWIIWVEKRGGRG